jgi:Protein of unknown function (DUF4199)
MKPELKYGLLAGVGVSLWILVEQLLGFHTTHIAVGEYSGYFSNLIPLTLLFLLLKGRRDAAGGQLALGPGLRAGLYASLIAALVVCCFLVAYSQFINPGWMDQALDWKVAQLRAGGVTEMAIREDIRFFRRANSPAGLILTTLAGMTVMGAIFSLGFTLLLRRWPRPAAGSVK